MCQAKKDRVRVGGRPWIPPCTSVPQASGSQNDGKEFSKGCSGVPTSLWSPRLINVQTKIYIRNELYSPPKYYNFKDSYRYCHVFFFLNTQYPGVIVQCFINGQAWAPTTKMNSRPSTAQRTDQHPPTDTRAANPGMRGWFSLLFPLSFFHAQGRFSWGGKGSYYSKKNSWLGCNTIL